MRIADLTAGIPLPPPLHRGVIPSLATAERPLWLPPNCRFELDPAFPGDDDRLLRNVQLTLFEAAALSLYQHAHAHEGSGYVPEGRPIAFAFWPLFKWMATRYRFDRPDSMQRRLPFTPYDEDDALHLGCEWAEWLAGQLLFMTDDPWRRRLVMRGYERFLEPEGKQALLELASDYHLPDRVRRSRMPTPPGRPPICHTPDRDF